MVELDVLVVEVSVVEVSVVLCSVVLVVCGDVLVSVSVCSLVLVNEVTVTVVVLVSVGQVCGSEGGQDLWKAREAGPAELGLVREGCSENVMLTLPILQSSSL